MPAARAGAVQAEVVAAADVHTAHGLPVVDTFKEGLNEELGNILYIVAPVLAVDAM